MGATAAMKEAESTGVVVVATSYRRPAVMSPHPRPRHMARAKKKVSIEDLCNTLEDSVFFPLLRTRSVTDFRKLRKDLFPRYTNLAAALGELADGSSVDQDATLDSLLDKIRMDANLPWPSGAKREALFCASTLERSYMLLSAFVGKPLPEEYCDEDRKTAGDFTLAAIWAQMNLDLIACALYHHRALDPTRSVLGGVVTGMRTAVLAYANARKGYELRTKDAKVIREAEEGQWEEEDEALLSAVPLLHSVMEAQP